MPESKPRKRTPRPNEATTTHQYKPNPVWYKPVMFGLMIIGLLWIITYYITSGQLPIPAWQSWNIVAGFGVAIVGFLMTTRWRS
ncbi:MULTISPECIES: cell division protein CrgA [Arthrobacter]|uniref:Cell division protein CrgA n=1 Tax=Arthrobacter terricola TaxID=2547396 RepID=A0A4R5KQW3_9MICC|nr:MULTISPECIES: cell division protein CrgA [Arthrobacter]MBT8160853.1 cell division protein CrgA [Arthrobacter sp. GN70]TDF97388.1 cell division protein CrgA [Arthrobacter terricola]HKU30904.1 cell division protein CrgA [Arthrobacter sp.]